MDVTDVGNFLPGSNIITTGEHKYKIIGWLNNNPNINTQLIYSGSINGWTPANIH